MSIESSADLDGMRLAGHITRLSLDALEKHVRAGISTPRARRDWRGGLCRPCCALGALTIEPMVSAGSSEAVQDRNGWTIRAHDGSLAAHHEHTLLITHDEPVLLTA